MPGVSRSGITISAGRFLGLTRDAAARLSFLLLVPTVLGAVLLKGVKDVLLGDLPPGWKGPFLVGVLAAWGSGLLAIQWLLGYVRRTPTACSSSTPAAGGGDPAPDRQRRPRGHLLTHPLPAVDNRQGGEDDGRT